LVLLIKVAILSNLSSLSEFDLAGTEKSR